VIELFGIPNCNSVKKAIKWLKNNNVPYQFHDYKKEGITKKKLKEWCDYFGWEKVLNKAGTTWRELSEEEKNAVTTQQRAIDLMAEKTSSIKRPITEANGTCLIRFNEDEYRQVLLGEK
jgi:Spx/MgsR family transcriptional regulator